MATLLTWDSDIVAVVSDQLRTSNPSVDCICKIAVLAVFVVLTTHRVFKCPMCVRAIISPADLSGRSHRRQAPVKFSNNRFLRIVHFAFVRPVAPISQINQCRHWFSFVLTRWPANGHGSPCCCNDVAHGCGALPTFSNVAVVLVRKKKPQFVGHIDRAQNRPVTLCCRGIPQRQRKSLSTVVEFPCLEFSLSWPVGSGRISQPYHIARM